MNYLRWLQFWSAYILAFVAVSFMAVVTAEKLLDVPLRFTKSISYDVKVKFIHDRLPTSQYDTFVVGSSMALNNIDSAVLESAGVARRVLNVSSWGLGTSESLQLLQMLDLSNVRKVIYASQYFDNVGEVDKVLDEQELRRYLNGDPVLKTYFKNIARLPGSLWDYWDIENVRGDKRTLGYLGFDANGDVNVDSTDFRIKKGRWAEIPRVPNIPIGDEYFKHLLAMHQYLRDRGIQLVVVTNPFRNILLRQNPEFRAFFSTYRTYLGHLASREGFVYVDAHSQLDFDDGYFMDPAHLHAVGAERVTRLIVKQVKDEQVSGLVEH